MDIFAEVLMWEKSFTIPEIILIAGTRTALGAGLERGGRCWRSVLYPPFR